MKTEGPLLVLASASPRRLWLLGRLGLTFDVAHPDGEELPRPRERPERMARRLAREKALSVARLRPEAFVIAADTVVVYRGRILGKPLDRPGAQAMLRLLRGRTHRVITAVAVAAPGRRAPLLAHSVTAVRMRRYTDEEIAASIARADPFDKAGAYAIQDPVFRPVASYDGCYCNVVGLPLWRLLRVLGEAHAPVPLAPALLPECAACPDRPAFWG